MMKLTNEMFLKLMERASVTENTRTWDIAKDYYLEELKLIDIARKYQLNRASVTRIIQKLNQCIETINLVPVSLVLSPYRAHIAKMWEKEDKEKEQQGFKKIMAYYESNKYRDSKRGTGENDVSLSSSMDSKKRK